MSITKLLISSVLLVLVLVGLHPLPALSVTVLAVLYLTVVDAVRVTPALLGARLLHHHSTCQPIRDEY